MWVFAVSFPLFQTLNPVPNVSGAEDRSVLLGNLYGNSIHEYVIKGVVQVIFRPYPTTGGFSLRPSPSDLIPQRLTFNMDSVCKLECAALQVATESR